MAEIDGIAKYFLYAESAPAVELDFLHIETIPVRSGKHDWTIRAHSHPQHTQFLLVSQGGGILRIEDRQWSLAPPCLMVVPVAMVHELTFTPGTDGHVLTVASVYLRSATKEDQGLADHADMPDVYALSADQADELQPAFESLHREFVWAAPGRRTAIFAHLQRILVGVLRLGGGTGDASLPSTGEREIVLRYRALLEEYFRSEKRLGFYADRLAVTMAKLNACCQSVIGIAASTMLHDRLVIEAKRNLLYTRHSVAEIAHAIGFDDPAYFNRFFAQRVGVPPGVFRANSGVEPESSLQR